MNEVEKIMSLAKLSLREEEKKRMEDHFRKILEYVKILDELQLEEVKPLYYPHETELRLRKDKEGERLRRDEILRGAPDAHLFYFRCPSPLREIRKK